MTAFAERDALADRPVSARVKTRHAVSAMSPAIATTTGTPPATSWAANGRALTRSRCAAHAAVWQADRSTIAACARLANAPRSCRGDDPQPSSIAGSGRSCDATCCREPRAVPDEVQDVGREAAQRRWAAPDGSPLQDARADPAAVALPGGAGCP